MYRFLGRPRWILSHLFVLAVVVAFVSAGLWQLRRLDERRDRNAVAMERTEDPVVAVEQLLDPGATTADVTANVFRRVEAEGAYVPAEQVLVRNRTLGGSPGYWVLTPLELEDGRAVVVNRGWVPFGETDPDGGGAEYPPPEGPVRVSGTLQESQRREGLGAADPAEGRLSTLSRVDVARLGAQSERELLGGYIDLVSQDPPPGALPTPVDPPELGEGPHLGYAVQWFIFTTVVVVGYPLALRRIGRQRQGSGDAGADIAVDPREPRHPPEPRQLPSSTAASER